MRPSTASTETRSELAGANLAARLGWFNGPVALALGATIYPGQLIHAPAPISAVAGVARFSTLSITAAGFYTLRASTTAAGFATADPRSQSAPFQIVDLASPCDSARCSATLGATTITGAAGAATGLVLLSRNVGSDPVCAGYAPPVGDTWYEFVVTAQRSKTIVVNYTKEQMRTLKNAGALEICFATPGPGSFPAKGGTAPFDYDGDGVAEGFVGLLVDCPAIRTDPCVSNRGPLPGGGASIEFFVPSGLGDPLSLIHI